MLPFLIYCLAVGAGAVPKINVILALLCIKAKATNIGLTQRSISSDDICVDPAVHSEMGRFVGYGNLISGILCAISSPRIGRWSDRYGRKPFIAFSAIGMLSGDAISLLAAWFPRRISVYWILLEFVIGGLTGAFLTTVALIQAYATDISPLETRASVFSMLHACMYLGLALGPAAGAFFVHNVGRGDIVSIFYVAGACHALFILYVLVAIPESLPKPFNLPAPTLSANKRPSKPKIGGVYNIFCLDVLSILGSSQDTSAKSRYNLPILAAIDALSFGVQVGLAPLLVLFSEYQFHWKTYEASLLLSATNITRATILALLLPAAIAIMSSSSYAARSSPATSNPTPLHPNPFRLNIVIIRVCLLLVLLANLGLAFSKHALPFIIFGMLSATGAPVSALAQSSMTNNVSAERVGELFGIISLFHAVSRAVVPALMYFLYSLTLKNAPAALFWAVSVVFGVAFLGALRVNA